MKRQEIAENTGLKALTWLVGNDELLSIFMGATGIGADDLRARAGEAELLASVLDFLMLDDAWVIAFCDANGLSYEAPMRARMVLPGGAEVSWT